MKSTSIEALFLDRALGELSPETAELLDDWCRLHPVEAAAAAPLADTLAQARQAVALDCPRVEKALPPPRWAKRHRDFHLVGWLRLAACFALGVGCGWFLLQNSGSRVATPPPPSGSTAALVPPLPAPTPATTTTFWSVPARVAEISRHPVDEAPRPAPRLRFSSLSPNTPQP